MSPFYTAYEAGYFRDAGIDVELTRDLPNMQSTPLLAAGKLDVGFFILSPGLLNAVARGARLRIAAGRQISSPSCDQNSRIYVRSADFPNGIQDMRQLRHRKIAVKSGTTIASFCLDKLLESVGMSRADVEVRPMGVNECVAALRTGVVDAIVSSSAEGDLSLVAHTLKIEPGPGLADVLPNFQYSFIVFGARLLDGNVRTGASFLRAYFRGAQEYLAGRTPAFLDQFAKSNGLDPKLLRAGCRDSFEHAGRIHFDDVQMFAEWAASRGEIPRPMSAQSLVDTRFLDAMQRMS